MEPQYPNNRPARKVQRDLFSGLDPGGPTPPSSGESTPRNGAPVERPRPARPRGFADQSFLPFGRPKEEPKATPEVRLPPGSEFLAGPILPPPVLTPEARPSGEVTKARELLHAIRVLKRVEGEGRRPD